TLRARYPDASRPEWSPAKRPRRSKESRPGHAALPCRHQGAGGRPAVRLAADPSQHRRTTGRSEPMKQAIEETANGTPDAAPAVIKPTKARRQNDQLAVECVLGIKRDKGKPKVEMRHERELWRYAEDLAGPSPSPLAASLALTVALCEVDVRLRQ